MKKYENRPQNWMRRKSRARRARRARVREEALYAFDAMPDLEELADVQGDSPVTNYDEVTSEDNWPEDQGVEEFIAAATEGRYEEDKPDS